MVYNESDQPVSLTFRNAPKHLDFSCEPAVIEPKGEARVNVTFVTDRVKDWGPHKDLFDIFVKGKESKMKNNHISVFADIWEDFSDMDAKEMASAPEIEISDLNLSMGKDASNRTKEVTIRNTGKKKLVIRKVQNDTEKVFEVKLNDTVINPGETTTMRVTYNPAGGKNDGKGHHITIISNDPRNSRVLMNLQVAK